MVEITTLCGRLRTIAPKRKDGCAPPVGAINLPADMTLWDLNALINDAATTLEQLTTDLDTVVWLGANTNLELHHYRPAFGDDDDQSEEWRVTRVSGGYNDREWTTVGRGETPLLALKSAREALSNIRRKGVQSAQKE